MKKHGLILIALLMASSAMAQTKETCSQCLPGGIVFSTQEQVDNFQTNYPGCTEIEGYVTIVDDDITNLNGLNTITSIGGSLLLFNCGALTNLTGLENLTSIGGQLMIGGEEPDNGNPALTNLTGLEGLVSIGGAFIIRHNSSLNSLTGLTNLSSIGGELLIVNNSSLSSLTGLENLESVGSWIGIYFNESLISLTGLENLAYIGSYIDVRYNYALSNCYSLCDLLAAPTGKVDIGLNAPGCNSIIDIAHACGGLPCLPYGNYNIHSQSDVDNFQAAFPNCTELQGEFLIKGNVTNLSGLHNLTSIGGNFIITNTSPLPNLIGLEALNSIGGYLSINKSHSLTSLTGLEGLTSIEGHLFIGDIYIGNNSLTSLMGLNNLTTIGGSLIIRRNNALTSLAGLESIAANSIGSIYISSNSSLTSCEVKSICDYLAAPNGSIGINQNAPGCNSREEVEAACETVGVVDIIPESEFTIAPNPASNLVTVSSKNNLKIETIAIYNQLGQQVLFEDGIIEKVAISFLGQGIYIVELTSGELKVRQKLIIKD
jgi:hypothetical protein